MVDVEERRLEVGLDAVRDEQPLDHADQRVLRAVPEHAAPCDAVEVAEHRDELRQRDRVDGAASRARSRALDVPARGLDLRQRVERVGVAREGRQRGAVLVAPPARVAPVDQ